MEEQRRQISHKNEELNNAQQINLKLEQKLMDLQELNHSLKDELTALRITINSLDKDKDKLIINVDEKAEENVTLKEELSSKVRLILLIKFILIKRQIIKNICLLIFSPLI